MLKYIGKRILSAIVTLLIIITVVFVLVRQMPIEGYFDNFDKLAPAVVQQRLREMGLLDPMHVQLKNFYSNLLQGDLGRSARYSVGVPITQIIASKAPLSLLIGSMSLTLALVVGLSMGTLMARSRLKRGYIDSVGMMFIVLINAIPAAVYHIIIQAAGTGWLGISMLFDRGNPITWVLPIISLSLYYIAFYAMWLRRYMVDESNKDYVQLARAKGVSMDKTMSGHVFRNAFVPLVQNIPSTLMYAIVGSIYVESLYSIPGMGGLLVDVIQRQDNPMVQALVIIYSCIGVIGMLLGDLLMVVVDPRISFSKKEGAR